MTYIEKFWRDATAADVVRVMDGETVEARFRDKESQRWQSGFSLGGWMKRKAHPWLDGDASSWTLCQVYDPPQWFLNKPDPGVEFRLLGKFPDEATQPGDEVWLDSGRWVRSHSADTAKPQQANAWYRRKIEQPKPEPKHYVLQVGDTISTPSGRQAIVTELGIEVS